MLHIRRLRDNQVNAERPRAEMLGLRTVYGKLRMLSSSIAFHYVVVCMLHLSIYLATNKGPQMMSVKAMLDRVAGLESTLF